MAAESFSTLLDSNPVQSTLQLGKSYKTTRPLISASVHDFKKCIWIINTDQHHQVTFSAYCNLNSIFGLLTLTIEVRQHWHTLKFLTAKLWLTHSRFGHRLESKYLFFAHVLLNAHQEGHWNQKSEKQEFVARLIQDRSLRASCWRLITQLMRIFRCWLLKHLLIETRNLLMVWMQTLDINSN